MDKRHEQTRQISIDLQEKVGASLRDSSLSVSHPGRGVAGVRAPEHGEVVHAGSKGTTRLRKPVVAPGYLAVTIMWMSTTVNLLARSHNSHLLLKPLVNEISLYERPRLMPELELEDVEVAAAAEV